MQFHEIAGVFPMMNEDDYSSLKESIRKEGLLEPIWIYEEKIIDGRNRFKACLENGTPMRFREYEGEPNKLIDFVLGLNLSRRHLSPSEKACAAVEALGYYENRARDRQLRGKKTIDLTEKIPEGHGEAREEVGKLFGVNAHYVSDAKRIKNEDIAVFNKIREGRITVTDGKEIVKLPADQKELVLQLLHDDASKRLRDIKIEVAQKVASKAKPLGGKYRIILCDPPWQYDNFQGKGTRYGDVTAHYNTMSLEELKALPISEIADENSCALFLWTTYPKLPDAIEFLRYHSFEYVTVAFTWVKLNPSGKGYYSGMGFYTNSNAEIVLLGKKGKIQRVRNDIKQLIVTPVQEHSRKPHEVRERIVQLLGDLPRLEMFSRDKQIEGWSVWGDEV